MGSSCHRYCLDTTRNHPINKRFPQCVELLNDLLYKEGYEDQDMFDGSTVVINLDTVEALLAIEEDNRNRERSMDFFMGLVNTANNNSFIVLVELKLNVKNPNNLQRENLQEKVNHSISITSSDIPLYHNFIFIFQQKIKEQARSRLFRMNPQVPITYIVMDLNEFLTQFF